MFKGRQIINKKNKKNMENDNWFFDGWWALIGAGVCIVVLLLAYILK